MGVEDSEKKTSHSLTLMLRRQFISLFSYGFRPEHIHTLVIRMRLMTARIIFELSFFPGILINTGIDCKQMRMMPQVCLDTAANVVFSRQH